MPYVYYEELPDGCEAADVCDRAQVEEAIAARDALQASLDSAQEGMERLTRERDELGNSLAQAKARFADAFLSSATMGSAADGPQPEPVMVSSYDSIFKEV